MRAVNVQVLTLAAAALFALGTAVPAHAATSVVHRADGCRVEVWGLSDRSSNGRIQEYKVEFRCAGEPTRHVKYRIDLIEADRGKFGDVGGDNKVFTGPDSGGWRKATPRLSPAPYLLKTTKSHDVAGDKRGEFYQRVCYTVHPSSGIERCVKGPVTVVRVS